MANVVFLCPRTGMNVQHWLAGEVLPGDPRCAYESLTCPACTRLHFINWSTGKLLGEKRELDRLIGGILNAHQVKAAFCAAHSPKPERDLTAQFG